ncbi:MAG: transposase [Cytophagaceae bacterium]|nr:transposase [Cytophagaceae bacterium]
MLSESGLNKKPIRLVLLLFLICSKTLGQDTIYIRENADQYFISGKNLAIVEDTKKIYTIDSVVSGKLNSLFQQAGKTDDARLQKSNTGSAYWLKFQIVNKEKNPRNWIIEFPDEHADNIEFYTADAKGNFIKKTAGDQFPFKTRTYNHKNFEFKIDLAPDKVQTYYVRIQGQHPITLLAWIRSDEKFTGYALNEYIVLGMFYGLVLLMATFNFILFIYIRNTSYIFYVLYVIGIGWYSLSRNGLGFQYLWPQNPEWNNTIIYVAIFFAVVFQLLYTQSFLKLKENALYINKIFNYFILVRVVIFLTGYFIYRPLLTFLPLDIISLLLSFCAGVIVFRNGYKPARLFLLGFGCLYSGFIVESLESMGLIPNGILQVYATDIGASFEMLFLSLAFADQLKVERKAKELAQLDSIRELRRNETFKKIEIKKLEENKAIKNKIKLELDTKVLERTKELNEANQMLIARAEEVNKLNSKIDIDNSQLKNNIKELIKGRVTQESITLEAFSKIFPDESACYKYISNLKWKQGYKCRKCGNQTYSNGLEPYSRRCASCNYIESATSNTLFHKLKFPISKAFYMLFLISRNSKITIDELSTALNLRRNTCWNFKNKIQNSIAANNKEDLGSDIKDWDLLIINPPSFKEEDTGE